MFRDRLIARKAKRATPVRSGFKPKLCPEVNCNVICRTVAQWNAHVLVHVSTPTDGINSSADPHVAVCS